MDSCLVLEDNTNTIRAIRQRMKDRDVKAAVSTQVSTFKRQLDRLKDQALRTDVTGILLDNHIDGCDNLSAWGKAEVTTNGGSEAGFKIATEVILPAMKDDQLPLVPIGIMSAHDVSKVRENFNKTFANNNSIQVYFFDKDIEIEENRTLLDEFLERMKKTRAVGATLRDRAYIKLLKSFRDRYGISNDDMAAIFRMRAIGFDEAVARGTVSVDNDQWHEMAQIIVKVDANLVGGLGSDESSARRWFSKAKVGHKDESPIEILRSGEIARARMLVDESSFAID